MMEFTNLGGLDKPVDTRDIKLGAAVAPTYTFPSTYTSAKAWGMPVEMQGKQPACGAHAGGALEGITRSSRYSPRYTWADLKTFDGFPIDAGTDMRSIFKSITKDGVLDFGLLGNDATLSLEEYAHPAITSAMKLNAGQHTGYGYGFIQDLTFKGLKQFIFDHGPSIILFRVGKEMWSAPDGTISWAEKDVLPMRPPQSPVGGHFVVVHSWDEQYIYYINSWSTEWGRKGHGYFGENYMPYVYDVGALFALSFPKDLQLGMNDPDVLKLQQTLNKNPQTRVAQQGSGSPGLETTYFGQLTQAAVKKFQTLHGITATGYVGPLTRAILNKA